jgi:AcrR family transcriptional regulator
MSHRRQGRTVADKPELALAERVLDAAATLLARHGIRRTSMDDVAREARCARPTIYRYYPNRDALLGALLLREVGRYLEALDELHRKSTSARLLEDSFVFTLTYMRGHPVARGLLSLEADSILPLLQSASGDVMTAIVDAVAVLVSRQMDEGILRKADPRLVAEAFIRFVASFVFLPVVGFDPEDERSMRRLFRESLLKGLLD